MLAPLSPLPASTTRSSHGCSLWLWLRRPCANRRLPKHCVRRLWDRGERADFLQSLYPEPVDAQFGFFLQLLATNDRLSLLPAIDAHFQRFSADLQQSLVVDIHAAEPLSKAEQDTLAKRLNKLLQRDVELRCQQDASLLGGALIRAGDTVIDGSLRGRLARLAEALTA